ncbi:outer envelope protein 64, mitochondrial-like [Miscanthus floridulus]|uniref:outer envelope protein 64, mitochondrial-like n=1 Tax=Miscanthus floridulus TaxID=154761 RepID=UPI003457B5C6
MASSSQSGGAGGGGTIASNPRVWIVAGIAVAGVIVLAEVARRRRRWLRGMSGTPPDSGSFCDRFELHPPPQPPPPAARHLLSGLTFAASDNFEIEGYVAGFGNPDWKNTHEAARHTAVAVTMLRKQGATCVGRTIMDELGFGVTGENLHHGTPANPVSPSLVPGGSCSGSAVAVAAQLVDFAIGTDTIGDVRIPASFCGLLCFRPSYGVISTLGTIANSQSLDTIGWFARDPCILHRVGILLPAAAGVLKQTRQIVFADDCFQLLKVSNQKTVHAIKNAVQALRGYQPPKHINLGQYICSNVPSLKEFCEPATKLQEGTSALKAISTVMLLLQRYEFKVNHEEWVNTVKPKLGLDISTRVLQAVNLAHENIKSLYAIRNELRAALKNLLKVAFHKTLLLITLLTTDAPCCILLAPFPETSCCYGNSAFKRRQWSKAIEFYSEAISLSDTNATYYCNRAAAYLELGRLKQAEADCDRALLLDRKNVKAYLRRGCAREVTLNYKEALQDFRHALALEPQNKTALAAERRLQKLLK